MTTSRAREGPNPANGLNDDVSFFLFQRLLSDPRQDRQPVVGHVDDSQAPPRVSRKGDTQREALSTSFNVLDRRGHHFGGDVEGVHAVRGLDVFESVQASHPVVDDRDGLWIL